MNEKRARDYDPHSDKGSITRKEGIKTANWGQKENQKKVKKGGKRENPTAKNLVYKEKKISWRTERKKNSSLLAEQKLGNDFSVLSSTRLYFF